MQNSIHTKTVQIHTIYRYSEIWPKESCCKWTFRCTGNCNRTIEKWPYAWLRRFIVQMTGKYNELIYWLNVGWNFDSVTWVCAKPKSRINDGVILLNQHTIHDHQSMFYTIVLLVFIIKQNIPVCLLIKH